MQRFRNLFCTNSKKEVYAILWKEASFTYEDISDNDIPNVLRTTVGFIIEAKKDYIKIATNIVFNESDQNMELIDGFIIPKRAIISKKRVGKI